MPQLRGGDDVNECPHAVEVGRLIERLDRCQKAILRAEQQDRPTTLRLELTYYQEQLDVASAWARERIEEVMNGD